LHGSQPNRRGRPLLYGPPSDPPLLLRVFLHDRGADLVDSALSGHDLIVRELGATVVEEYTNE
ncbi:hypothetical protein, partial [Streptomyces lunaelactis]|uniref:hypothetical protein n=1 Tax=Streptomyces lunaelactis TaxID=1535768 RepID=UPI001C30F516